MECGSVTRGRGKGPWPPRRCESRVSQKIQGNSFVADHILQLIIAVKKSVDVFHKLLQIIDPVQGRIDRPYPMGQVLTVCDPVPQTSDLLDAFSEIGTCILAKGHKMQ